MSEPLLSVEKLSVTFAMKKQTVQAVNAVSFDIYPGEAFGIVGESGCGKSTLSRAILGLVPTSGGRVLYAGDNLLSLTQKQWLPKRKDLQIIFQDPFSAVNPRLTIYEIISEPVITFYPRLSRQLVYEKVKRMMTLVGLDIAYMNHYPHELSGGQCQRIGIARALILEPRLIIGDEPVSALDVSIQAQILNLLQDLQRQLNFSLIFISHNLSVVRYLCHRVMVMYAGQVVELAETQALFNNPQHPYTRLLLSAIPRV